MRVLALSAALLLASACATPSSSPPLPAMAVDDAPAPPAPRPKKKKKKMRVSELAARLDSPDACRRAVSRLAISAEGVAWNLMRKCIQQSKFTDLQMLTKAPWRQRLARLPPVEQARLLTHVMAMRGARFDVDLALVDGLGPRLYELYEIVELGGGGGPVLVVFRGMVEDRELLRSGLTRFSITETTPEGVLLRRDVSQRAKAVFKVRRTRRSLRIGEEFVFLGRTVKVDGDRAELSVLGNYKRGVRAAIGAR